MYYTLCKKDFTLSGYYFDILFIPLVHITACFCAAEVTCCYTMRPADGDKIPTKISVPSHNITSIVTVTRLNIVTGLFFFFFLININMKWVHIRIDQFVKHRPSLPASKLFPSFLINCLNWTVIVSNRLMCYFSLKLLDDIGLVEEVQKEFSSLSSSGLCLNSWPDWIFQQEPELRTLEPKLQW